MNCDVLSIGVFNIVILDVWVCDVIIYMLVEWIVFYKNCGFFLFRVVYNLEIKIWYFEVEIFRIICMY